LAAAGESYRLKIEVLEAAPHSFLNYDVFLKLAPVFHSVSAFIDLPDARNRLCHVGKNDILSDPEQTYTLVIHKTMWITYRTTVLFAVHQIFISSSRPTCFPSCPGQPPELHA
jgi:hypothetical protein